MSVRLPLSPCRICGSPNDAATDMRGSDSPKPGDFCVCVNCGAIGVYTDAMTIRAPSDAERAEFPDIGLRAISMIKDRGRFRQ